MQLAIAIQYCSSYVVLMVPYSFMLCICSHITVTCIDAPGTQPAWWIIAIQLHNQMCNNY